MRLRLLLHIHHPRRLVRDKAVSLPAAGYWCSPRGTAWNASVEPLWRHSAFRLRVRRRVKGLVGMIYHSMAPSWHIDVVADCLALSGCQK